MNALLELRKQMEIDFLKTKTYEEINDMFNQLNDKLSLAESEVKKFRLGAVSNSEVFEHYGKPFTSGRDLWDFLTAHYNFTQKT